MSYSEYLEKFKGLVEVCEHFGGQPGITEARVAEALEEEAVHTDNPTEAELAAANQKARETYLATLFLVKSDPRRYGALVADLENDHTRGMDGYPTMLSATYDMIFNYRQQPTSRFSR